MTTLTVLSDEEAKSPLISLNPTHTIADIDPLIYGGFTEHMGRCIYGGIYDPDNKNGLITEQGYRTDVIDSILELKVPVIRYPGGNFVATYRWQDGIGPRDQRPKRPELAWLGVESNQFGTDEFIEWCRIVKTEPYICFNMGTGTLEDALAWLEYCNGDRDTYYANLRRKNGHEEPYKVKYWALGNEIWGPWQVEQATKEDYAKKAIQWAKALKLLDPSIQLILCGRDGVSDWDRYVLQQCSRYIDMHSIHFYHGDASHYPNISGPYAAERAIQITSSLIDLARCELDLTEFPDFSRITTAPKTAHRPKICFDEWNVWDPIRAPGDKGAEELYNLSDALAVAIWLNIFVRNAKDLGMATIAQSVNVISPLMTSPTGITRQTTYWPLLLFSRYMHGRAVAVHVRAGVYKGETNPKWIQSTVDVPKLDVSAALDGEWLNVAVVNVDEEHSFETELAGVAPASGDIQVFKVGGEKASLKDVNKEGRETIAIEESTVSGKDVKTFVFEKHSFTLLRWKV
ncbi:glycoside hydrolase superfamily [Pestalotiopsis sp. NC0098]|nr:glycoside hydrolase superfamily [Pestalotiopsis sp. NC0098]